MIDHGHTFLSDDDANESLEDSPTQSLSINEAIDSVGYGKFQIIMFILTGAWLCADGMELSMLAFLMPELSKQWPEQDGAFWKPMASSVTFVGVFIGSFIWGRISDRYGRRLANLGTNLVIGIFGLLTAFAPNFAFVAVSRFCAGLGMGGTTVAFALYVEHLPIKRRGSYLVLFSFWWTLGIVIQSFLAAVYLSESSPDSWRYMVGISALPFFILAAAYPWIPESPHWLVLSGRKQDAAFSLRWMAAVNGTQLPYNFTLRDGSVGAEMPKLKESMKTLFGPTLRLVTILLLTMWFAMNLSYYGAVLFTPEYFRVGTGGSMPGFWSVVLISAGELPGMFLSAFLVEKIGRRGVQYSFMSIVGVSMFFLLFLSPEKNGLFTTVLLLVSRSGMSGGYAATWSYTSEVFPTTVRATGLGLANSVAKTASVMSPWIATTLLSISPRIPISIFSLLSFAAAVAAFFLPVETSSRELAATVDQLPQDQGNYEQAMERLVSKDDMTEETDLNDPELQES